MHFTGDQLWQNVNGKPFWEVKYRELLLNNDHAHCAACDAKIAERNYFQADTIAWVHPSKDRGEMAPVRWVWLCRACFDQWRIPHNLVAAKPGDFPVLHRNGPQGRLETEVPEGSSDIRRTPGWTMTELIAVAKFLKLELCESTVEPLAPSLRERLWRTGGFEVMRCMHDLLVQVRFDRENGDDLSALFDFQKAHVLYPLNVLGVTDFVRLDEHRESRDMGGCEYCGSDPMLSGEGGAWDLGYEGVQGIGFPGSIQLYQRRVWLCHRCFEEWRSAMKWRVVPGPLVSLGADPLLLPR